MKIYRSTTGARTPGPLLVIVEKHDAKSVFCGYLDPAHGIRNHSPDGFQFGYAGSGPAQLALAILVDLVGSEIALQHYQEFKREVIAALPSEVPFRIEEPAIREWLATKIAERASAG